MTDPPIWKDEPTSEDAGREHRGSGAEKDEIEQFVGALLVGQRSGHDALTATDVGFLMGNSELHKRTGVAVANGQIVETGRSGPCVYHPTGRVGKLWRLTSTAERQAWAAARRER
jgi:hypothetical protein